MVALLALACSEGSQSSGGTAGAAGMGGAAGAGGTAGTGGECLPVVDCPAEVPNEGAACAPGLLCYYRDNINIDNQTVARCVRSSWLVRVETGEGECPATQPVMGEVCDQGTVQTAACYYEPVYCECPFGPYAFWTCYELPGEDCPPQPPVAGTCCDVDVDFGWCTYEPCDSHHPTAGLYECIAGVWSDDAHVDCGP